jgi:hypothetical protein
LWADLHLSDRQLLDANGRFAGMVDDIEFDLPHDGAPPVLSALLVGRGALTRRLHRRFGSWLESLHARLHPEHPLGPVRIPVAYIHRIANAIELSVSREQLGLTLIEDTLANRIIGHIPGAGHAPQ